MRALITGSSGFVGRAFVRRLLANRHHVTGVDIVPMRADPRIHGFTERMLITMDVREFIRHRIPDVFDLIIHCAAVIGGRQNMEDDPLGVATNLSIDSEFFAWLVRAEKRKPRVVYFSSSAVYPPELQERGRHCALAESLVDFASTRFALPETTYGFAKFAGEYLARQAVQKHDAQVVIYRPFGGYGEDQDLAYPFPRIVRRVLDGEDPVVVWGSGDQERDFIHVDDVVRGVLSTYERLVPGATLNLGTGNGIGFKRLAELICVIAGHKAKVIADPSKPEGVFSRIADIYNMEQWFVPKITLAEGIQRALDAGKKMM